MVNVMNRRRLFDVPWARDARVRAAAGQLRWRVPEVVGAIVMMLGGLDSRRPIAWPDLERVAKDVYPRRWSTLLDALRHQALIQEGPLGTWVVPGQAPRHRLVQQRVAAGQASGRARAAKSIRAKAAADFSAPAPRAVEAPPAQLTLTPLPSATPRRRGKAKAKAKVLVAEIVTPAQQAWSDYARAYSRRYGQEPTRNVRVNSQIKQFVDRVGGADAGAILSFYVEHSSFTYVKKLHPIGMALLDAESLRTQWLNGRAVTDADARGDSKFAQARSQIERIERGEL